MSVREGSKEDKRYVEENFWNKLARIGKSIPFIRDVIALYKYMKDPKVHWARKSIAVGALVYFIVPTDAIPDAIPVVGYLDDAGVVAATVKYLDSELEPYYE